jgi:hypothetical protein
VTGWGAPRVEDGWVRVARSGSDLVDVQIGVGDTWQPAYHDGDDVMVRPPDLPGVHVVAVRASGQTIRVGSIRL